MGDRPAYEWCQRFHVDGIGYYVNIGTPFERVVYTNARRDAAASESYLRSSGWSTVRIVNEPGHVRIHACRLVEASP